MDLYPYNEDIRKRYENSRRLSTREMFCIHCSFDMTCCIIMKPYLFYSEQDANQCPCDYPNNSLVHLISCDVDT